MQAIASACSRFLNFVGTVMPALLLARGTRVAAVQCASKKQIVVGSWGHGSSMKKTIVVGSGVHGSSLIFECFPIFSNNMFGLVGSG